MKDVIHQDYLTVEMTLTIKTNSYKLNNKMFIIVIVKCYWLFFLLLFYSISSSFNVVFFQNNRTIKCVISAPLANRKNISQTAFSKTP